MAVHTKTFPRHLKKSAASLKLLLTAHANLTLLQEDMVMASNYSISIQTTKSTLYTQRFNALKPCCIEYGRLLRVNGNSLNLWISVRFGKAYGKTPSQYGGGFYPVVGVFCCHCRNW